MDGRDHYPIGVLHLERIRVRPVNGPWWWKTPSDIPHRAN